MKEERIIAFIGAYGSMCLASTFKNMYLSLVMASLAIILIVRYIYLCRKN